MLIRQVKVADLLSFEALELSFSEGLNVIVGQNDIGKSNIIRLVKLVRDAVVGSAERGVSLPQGVEDRFVRLGKPVGRVALAISLTEERERALMLLFVRAVAATIADSSTTGHAGPVEHSSQMRDRIASYIERSLEAEKISALFEGRLVMTLDRRQPVRWALAFEFDFESATYHIGIAGSGILQNSVVGGPFHFDRPYLPNMNARLLNKVDLTATSDWEEAMLSDLLPEPGSAVTWDLSLQTNGRPPLTTELSRELGLAADQSRSPDLWRVLRDTVGRGIAVTSNLRRPPQATYNLEDARQGLAVEDAGDLPLELYRWKTGESDRRAGYAELQRQFGALTGREFDLRTEFVRVPGTDPALHELLVEVQVETQLGWVSIEHSGAGQWEALVALSTTLPQPGRVVLLDEPATHLHSTWQSLFLRYLRTHHQVVLITHSPFLVPSENVADLSRVVRLTACQGRTVAKGIGQDKVPESWRERWRPILAGSADARSALFTRGVVLVEGETDLGSFRRWFNDSTIVEKEALGLEGRNLLVLSVDGDWNFGPYVSYLERIGVPWVIITDGPAMSPAYKHSLNKGLRVDEATGERVTKLTRAVPADVDDFIAWARYWERNGAYSVATQFGLKENGEKFASDSAESGEIERFFASLDPELWANVRDRFSSKVRCGYAFAEELDLGAHPEAREKIKQVWRKVVRRLER